MRKHLTHYPVAWLVMYCLALAIAVPMVLLMNGPLWMGLAIAAVATLLGGAFSRAVTD